MARAPTVSTLTKITRPRLGNYYQRTRLFQRLDECRQRSIVWITSPPGAGKTTLVTSYLAERQLRCLWYQVDEGDADAASFFYYMGLAAKKAAPRRKKSLPLLTPEYALGVPTFTRHYFEQLYSWLKPPFVVVLDNYQAVPVDSPFHEVLRDGLEIMPEGGNAIVISREEPPPAFARLRANQCVAIIDWDALRLDDQETAEIVRLHRKKSSGEEDIRQLRSHTGGWMAGLVLLLENAGSKTPPDMSTDQSLEDHSPQIVFDYFATEILERQDAVTQDFLLQTALLPRMTPRMAYKLTGVQQSEKILARLNRNRYFTDRHTHSEGLYEFHPLFREFLLARSRQVCSAVEYVRLQHRAAGVLEASGQVEAAMDLFLSCGDWAAATRLVSQHAQAYIGQGRSITVTQWIHQVPEAVLEQAPWLQFWLGVSRMFNAPLEGQEQLEQAYWHFKKLGDIVGMCMALASIVDTFSFGWHNFYPLDGWIEELEALMLTHPELPPPELQARVAVAMFVALMHRRPDHPDMEYWTQQAREIVRNIPGANERVIIGMHLGTYYVWWGRHRDMTLLLEELRPLLEGDDISPMGFISFHAIEAMYYTRSLAGDGAKTALAGLERAEQNGVYVINPLLLGFAAISSMNANNLDAAEAYLAKSAALFHPARLMDQGFYHWNRGHLAWVQGDIPGACEHARHCVTIATQFGSAFHNRLVPITLAKILVEAGEYREATEILEQTLPAIREIDNPTLEYECLLIMAKSAFAQHNDVAGFDALQPAVSLMRQTGSESTIWWNPQWIVPLFARALEKGIEVKYVQSLIRRHQLIPEFDTANTENWPWPVKIQALGGFHLECDGEEVASSGKAKKKPLELLKALVAFGGRNVGETQLTDVLWPDAEGDDARHSLKTTMHRLRKLLGNEAVLQVEGGKLSLDPSYCWTDVWAFERLLDSGGQVAGDTTQAARSDRLSRAIGLYRGVLLSADEEASWMIAPREKLRKRYLRAVEDYCSQCEKCNNWDQAVEYYERGISTDGLAESFYQRLMACYARLGCPGEALATYERYCKALSTRFGVEPPPKMRAMAHELQS